MVTPSRLFSPASLAIIITLLLAVSCSVQLPQPAGAPTAASPTVLPTSPAQAAAPVTPTAQKPPDPTATAVTPTPLPDTGWQMVQAGMEKRLIRLSDAEGRLVDSIFLLRLQPDQFDFGVGYQPGQPRSLTGWQGQTGAVVIVNGGYFTPENTATGLIIVDGQASGSSFQGFGGMFAVGPDGPVLRSLRQTPYEPDEPLQHALQSFPLLISPGGNEASFDDSGMPSRRTVIARDRSGRFLFLVTQWGSFTLSGLSHYLLNSDLDLDIALNLDGGASSGIILGEPAEGVPSFSLLPVVITIHRK